MKYTILLSIPLFALACNKKLKTVAISDAMPTCIQDKIDGKDYDGEKIIAIKYQDIEGVRHYWMHTGAMAYDGPEYIVDENCQDLCSFQGMVRNECLEKYRAGTWSTLWERPTAVN